MLIINSNININQHNNAKYVINSNANIHYCNYVDRCLKSSTMYVLVATN